MDSAALMTRAEEYLHKLCYGFPSRRTGSAGNRMATDYFAAVVEKYGYEVECPEFACIDWFHGAVQLTAGGDTYSALVSPYALGCELEAELAVVTTVDELESWNVTGKVLLLKGEIASGQLMPKSFIFYNPDGHKKIIRLLEEKRPAAIVSATSRDPELAGGSYPFSLIEDGDFDIPSVYMTEEEGARLAGAVGRRVKLVSEAQRYPSTGCNVIARKQTGAGQKITVFAHIDAKDGTPGALDNGTGVVVLLLLAEMLTDYDQDMELELVAFNGEDYYSAAGEMQYWTDYSDDFERILLGVNIDAAGYREGATAYSMYGCPDELEAVIRRCVGAQPGMIEGEPWYQSDHSLFIQKNRPALAITSERFMELSTYVTHTEADTPDLVDYQKVVTAAEGLRKLILELAGSVR